MRDESEKEIVHRIEAFSDIVIGFSLAQLGLNLIIPAHARDLFTSVRGATGLIALVITFALVCAVWWGHHRLFRHLFVPTPLAIFANFAGLCGVIVLAYSMQILVHDHIDDKVAFAMYTGSYAWTTAFFTVIAWNGFILRGPTMNAPLRADSLKKAIGFSVVCVWMIAFTVVTVVFGMHSPALAWTETGLVVTLLAVRFATRGRRAAGSPSSPSV